jgi:hypothetical protein
MHLSLRGVCEIMFRGRATKALRFLVQSLLIGAALIYGLQTALAQTQQEQSPDHAVAPATQDQEATTKAQTPEVTPTPPILPKGNSEGKQPKRILWVIPNYRSVSANTQLPPLALKQKFWLATQDSFDYSSFILAGALAGSGQARNATPEFRQGAAGYGRYYWHSFVDQAVGNYFTEAIVPAATRQDPRYYTLGHGGFFRRTGYAVSRLLITKTDSGGRGFNFSEIIGNGAGAGVSDLYYPARERTWTKTGQKWLTQVAVDGVFNVLKEFWPDIDRAVFRGHYESRPVH